MEYSKPPLNWKALRNLHHQEQNGAISSTEVIRIFSSTKELLDIFRNEHFKDNGKWEDFCMFINLTTVVVEHAKSGSDVAKTALNSLVLNEDNLFLKFVLLALQTKFNSWYCYILALIFLLIWM